jgi:polar amino acid transport system substrate-binding protein
LKKRSILIEKPQDLDSLTVASFQGAEKRYPTWLKKVKNENRFYGVGDQLTQVKLLNFERYDVVLSDRYIFMYFSKQLKFINTLEINEVDEHKVIIANIDDYRPVFRSKKIRDDFNSGLKKLKDSGEFQKIYEKYMK